MTEDGSSNGVSVEEKRRPKGRGRGLTTLRNVNKDGDGQVGVQPIKDKDTKYLDESKEDKLISDEKSRSTSASKVRKTKAGYEPYQVKKNRTVNTTTINPEPLKSPPASSERGGDKYTYSTSQRRGSSSSTSSWKNEHKANDRYNDNRINDKNYDRSYDKSYDTQKSQTGYDQRNTSQNKSRSNSYSNNNHNNNMNNNNNKRNTYRTYTNKEKQKQSRRKRGGNENMMVNYDHRSHHRKHYYHENGDMGGLRDKTNRHMNEHGTYIDNNSRHYQRSSSDNDYRDMSRVKMTDNNYIEMYHDNKGISNVSLSNSESDIMYVKNTDSNNQVQRDAKNCTRQSSVAQSPSELEYASSEANNLTVEEMNIIKEMDNKRRIQGIGILECPCSLSLNGERIGFCDAHELIAEHNETIASSTLSQTVESADLDTVDPLDDKEVIVIEDEIDPIDEIYLTVSPIRDDEIESTVPSEDEIASSDAESNNDNVFIEADNLVSQKSKSSNLSSGVENSSESYVKVDKLSESNISCNDFTTPITLETSRNIDIENINALFMNLGRRQSCNSFNSSSFDSKMNSSCEKSWKSMDDFSPSKCFKKEACKSPSVILVSSDSSDESIDENASTISYSKEQYVTNEIIANSCSGFSSLSKSDTLLSCSKSTIVSSCTSSFRDAHPSSYPSLCCDHSELREDLSKISPHRLDRSIDDLSRKEEKQSSKENDIIQNNETNDDSLVNNIKDSDDSLDTNNAKLKQKLFHSLSEEEKSNYNTHENKLFNKVSEQNGSKESSHYYDDSDNIFEKNNKKEYNNKNENIERYDLRKSNNLNRSFSNDSSNPESSDSASDILRETSDPNLKENIGFSVRMRERNKLSRNASEDSSHGSIEFKEMACIRENNESHEQSDDDTNKAGMITLPNAHSATKSKTVPERADRFHLSSLKEEHGTRRQVRFSSTSDSRFSTSSSKHDGDSYMVREYMNIIKDKQFQLKKLLQHGFQSLEGVNVMLEMSEAIQQKFGELIVHNQEYSFRHNFENFLWKLAFYSIIAKFRAFLEDQDVPHSAVQKIGVLYWDFLQNGIQFLDSIIVQLQKQAHFDLNDYLKDPVKIGSCNKQVKYALRSCHLLLIFMGDLERYVSQFLQQEDYRNAKRYYQDAQILTPKNGKSYNQLAVVAVVTKHKLDAVYYYARSLQVCIPFLTAKDRLTAIFQEIQKKASRLKGDRKTTTDNDVGWNTNHTPKFNPNGFMKKNTDHLRDEVWIFYRDNQMFKAMLTEDNEIIYLVPPPKSLEEVKQESPKTVAAKLKLTLKEINRSYMILFLFVHCKLYTNIGLEEFTYVHQETLSDLSTLLRYPKASSIRKENLLKCIVINIFSVHNIMEKNGHEDLIPNTGLDLGIIFAMDMIAVLCKHCVHLFNTKEDITVADQFLPAVRVWILWLIIHSELVRKSTVCGMYDIWSDICDFFNIINALPLDDIIYNAEGCENIYLEEDLLLAGLKSLNNPLMYCSPLPGAEKVTVCQYRVENMVGLMKRLESLGNLPFTYDHNDMLYKPVLTSITSSSPVKKVKVLDIEDEVEVLADVIIEDDEEEFGDMSHVDELKVQKAALMKQIQENEDSREAAMAVLESHKHQGRHLSENSPTYIVADTNCYIDHLEYIAAILDSKSFTVVVPLIVINELDGLKKGSYFDESKSYDHQRRVQECAMMAVDYLEDQFSRMNSNVRAITSNGTEMDTIVFRAEEFSPDSGTNDDVILSCCLKYCKEHKLRREDNTNIISREVVLLTNDRNLRVKAHTRVVPTVDIATFAKMAVLI